MPTGLQTADLKDSEMYMSFPSYNFAMEYYVTSWLAARGGISSHNATDTFTDAVPPAGTGEEETKERNYEFMWTAGLGVD